MARRFDDSLTQYLVRVGAVVPGYPFTVSVHFLIDDPLTDPHFFGLSSSTSIYDAFSLRNWTGRTLQAWAKSLLVPGDTSGATSNCWTAGVWQHACGIYAAPDRRTAILNGDLGSKGVSTTSITPGPLDRTTLAALMRTTPMGVVSGRLAEAALWDTALSDDEAVALSQGVSPRLVRPRQLAAYWPLAGRGAVERDLWKHGYDLTPINGPSWAEHSRRFSPRPCLVVLGTAASRPVSGPYFLAAGEVQHPGAAAGELHCPGALAGQVHG